MDLHRIQSALCFLLIFNRRLLITKNKKEKRGNSNPLRGDKDKDTKKERRRRNSEINKCQREKEEKRTKNESQGELLKKYRERKHTLFTLTGSAGFVYEKEYEMRL